MINILMIKFNATVFTVVKMKVASIGCAHDNE